jgi:hypothetical protein
MTPAEQIVHYHTFGFLALRQAFGPDEIAEISRTYDDLLEQDRQREAFSGEKRQTLFGIAEKHPLLIRLVEDDRIYETVERLLGPGFIWLCSEGNLYVGDTEWHPDGGSTLDYSFMKVSLYLDPLTRDTGCLRVLPGSHRLPFHGDLKPFDKFGFSGPDVPCFFLESRPGDVFFLNMNMWHASFGGSPGRRHLALNFSPEPTQEEHIAMLKRDYQGIFRLMERFQYSRPDRVYTDAFLHSDSPRIQHLTSTWVELGLK